MAPIRAATLISIDSPEESNEGLLSLRGKSSGMLAPATGPHLHFEFYKDQEYVNPLSVDVPADEQIEPELQHVFDDQKRVFLVKLAATPEFQPAENRH